jgi:hypothetical protein
MVPVGGKIPCKRWPLYECVIGVDGVEIAPSQLYKRRCVLTGCSGILLIVGYYSFAWLFGLSGIWSSLGMLVCIWGVGLGALLSMSMRLLFTERIHVSALRGGVSVVRGDITKGFIPYWATTWKTAKMQCEPTGWRSVCLEMRVGDHSRSITLYQGPEQACDELLAAIEALPKHGSSLETRYDLSPDPLIGILQWGQGLSVAAAGSVLVVGPSQWNFVGTQVQALLGCCILSLPWICLYGLEFRMHVGVWIVLLLGGVGLLLPAWARRRLKTRIRIDGHAKEIVWERLSSHQKIRQAIPETAQVYVGGYEKAYGGPRVHVSILLDETQSPMVFLHMVSVPYASKTRALELGRTVSACLNIPLRTSSNVTDIIGEFTSEVQEGVDGTLRRGCGS